MTPKEHVERIKRQNREAFCASPIGPDLFADPAAPSSSNPYEQGRRDYEADVRARPTYHDGKPRPPWPQLDTIARGSWARGANRVTAAKGTNQ